ncbi:MAG: hypothetical protein ACRCWJ_03415, partial [Casimicrobium sp.]
TVPSGAGESPYCSLAHVVRTKQRTCLDQGGQTQPVRYTVPYDNGRAAIKLLFYPKTDSASTFHLVRADVPMKRERFVSQFDEANRLAETYNKALSISPDGARVAIVRNAPPLRDAPHYMKQGALELYGIDTGTWQSLNVDVLDGHPVQWLDSDRIMFARGVQRSSIPKVLIDAVAGDDRFGNAYSRSDIVPVIFLRDLRSNTERALHIGRIAIVSPNGREFVVQDDARVLRRVSFDDDSVRSTPFAALPAMTHHGVIGFASSKHVVYWAEPYAGRETQYTLSNSPLVGPKKLLSLRVANIDTGEFVTVVERIDPRARPSVAFLQ